MSQRFSLYAMDLSRFEQILKKPLVDLLLEYSKNGRQEEPGLYFRELELKSGNRWYHSRPAKTFVHDTTRWTGDQVLNHDMSEKELGEVPYLRQSLLDQLKNSNMSELWRVCDAFSEWDGAKWVEPLLRGYKWGPPKALLKIACRLLGSGHPTHLRMVHLFQKVARHLATHEPFHGRLYELSDFVFPVKPSEDCDVWLSVWTAEEARFLVETLDLLDREESSQSRNLYLDTIPPEDQGEEYFREMIQGLLRMRELEFEQLTVVGFVKC